MQSGCANISIMPGLRGLLSLLFVCWCLEGHRFGPVELVLRSLLLCRLFCEIPSTPWTQKPQGLQS